MSGQPGFTNRLASESSPYLRQHAHNPVDWYPWGPEALAQARQRDVPIFLSIGYSACHWCHVMERESFEDPGVAEYLNKHFVSIKVDREERPDLDQIYMTAVQLLTRQGGWPMSVFLTPDAKPFYGGTYFPPRDAYGRPSFQRVLEALVDAWQSRRAEVDNVAQDLTVQLSAAREFGQGTESLQPDLLAKTAGYLARIYDPVYGGFGAAPKFPHAVELRLLLRIWSRFGDEDALRMACHTLDQMARGGMYDQLGGGFHRYSTDARWLVPHFEKMLYDNALLAQTYLEAYQATGAAPFRQVTIETLDYVLREMTSPEGAFFSAQDADSEGVEGKYFVWSNDEVEKTLGKEDAEVFSYAYDVTREGNWEETNILHRPKTHEQEARLLGIDSEKLTDILARSRAKLLALRSQRIRPSRDDKVLTSWNGLMIAAFARAAAVLGEARYAQAASAAADFFLKRMRTPEGHLFRTWSAGAAPKLNAYLEDYAFLIDALIDVYEMDFDAGRLQEAARLADIMIEEFWDEKDGGFFFTGKSHESLIRRSKEPEDSSIPSGNGMAITALLRLGKHLGRVDLTTKGLATLQLFSGLMTASPTAGGQMLMGLDFHLGPVPELAVIGPRDGAQVQEALHAIRTPFLPRKVVAFAEGTEPETEKGALPLLAGKKRSGELAVYVCENFTCREPITNLDGLKTALKDLTPSSKT